MKDCARGIALVQTAATLRHRIYNVASGRGTRNRDLAAAVAKLAPGADVTLPQTPPAFPAAPALDLARIREDTGYAPRFDLEAGLADYLSWLRSGNEH